MKHGSKRISIKLWHLSLGGLVLLPVSLLLMVLGVVVEDTSLGLASMVTGVLLFATSIALIVPAK